MLFCAANATEVAKPASTIDVGKICLGAGYRPPLSTTEKIRLDAGYNLPVQAA
ncbi:MAG: hypothetical protein QOH05_4820 [Acetobacteraceae bacterium]|jgi:hypothetical protein|nr:hypothetical protein [Acetobacteraceae bacterium]